MILPQLRLDSLIPQPARGNQQYCRRHKFCNPDRTDRNQLDILPHVLDNVATETIAAMVEQRLLGLARIPMQT